ncbi:MAG: ribonuclease P protein subunit [Nitrososphaerota archaeon]|nr:ribonuclease P protein subunit [Nitrososphaerota archaeon]MDG7024311.1 ribonuclease P protein subunit [Nitrososphaerota archaeon]
MNVVGELVTVLSSSDRTKVGRTGLVLLDTAKTLVIESAGRSIRVEKSGAAFLLRGSGKVLTGSDIYGRLEDRLGRGSN